MLERKRPTGVTIIGILTIIIGILLLSGGVVLVALAPVISQFNLHDSNTSTFTSNDSFSFDVNGTNISFPNNSMSVLLGGFFAIIGGIMIVLGIAFFVVAWGLFKGKGWAWGVTVILSIITLVVSVLTIISGNLGSIFTIIISGVILYYLYRKSVKMYFGKIKEQHQE